MDNFHPGHPAWSSAAPERLDELRGRFPDFTWSDETIVQEQRLPFYPDLPFVIARDSAWEPANALVYVLVDGAELVHLNGTSPPIHELNGKGHLRLDDETTLGYLSFFCFFVCGDEGPFYVAMSRTAEYLPDSVRENGGEEHARTRDRFGDVFQSPRRFGRDDDGNRRFSATIFYSNAAFVGDFVVQPSGMIEMKGDFPVIADLPHKISAPLAPDVPVRSERPNGAGTTH